MTTQEMVMNFLTGPVSALALAVAILFGLGKFLGKYVPQIVEKHLEQVDKQMKAQEQICNRLDDMKTILHQEHAEQTEVFRKAISGLHGRLNPIENDVKEIKAVVGYKHAQTQVQNQI